jgi:hypothetical protein
MRASQHGATDLEIQEETAEGVRRIGKGGEKRAGLNGVAPPKLSSALKHRRGFRKKYTLFMLRNVGTELLAVAVVLLAVYTIWKWIGPKR